MAKLIKINEYSPTKNDKFFLDTNIWMYLYFYLGNYNKNMVEAYNSFYEKILEVDAEVFTTSMQISEFYNTYCRVEYNIKKKENPNLSDYKRDFRSSPEFLDLIKEINLIIRERILSLCTKVNDNFSETNIDEVLHDDIPFDFNDEYFLYICEHNNIIVVSNDKDIHASTRDITVISY